MSSVLESLFFAVGEDGLSIEELENILEIDEEKLNEELDNLKKLYEKEDRGITLKLLGNKYKLVTKAQNKEYIKKLTEEVSNTLSKSALETLAIIAYNPKITRAEIEAIRGVNSDGTIYKLLEFNLIENVGKADLPGRPTMYATTPNFLKMFGMSSLEELPELPKYKLDENQQLVIDDIIPSEDQSTIEKEEIASDETISEAPMPERENVDVIKNDNI